MKLTEAQRAMAAGDEGAAIAAAMAVLIEYGQIMGADSLIPITSAAGANIFGKRHFDPLGTDDPGRLFSEFSLNSDQAVDAPPVRVPSCQLIGPMDRINGGTVQGLTATQVGTTRNSQEYLEGLGVSLLSTCTPYQVGFLPESGDHVAWMESSAVIFINSVIGARTNTEGRESAAASMLTGLTPNAGLHLDENRKATVHVRVETDIPDTFSWNALGYWLGGVVGDRVPVLEGIRSTPDLVQLKQFGAAAASSGDVELYHIPGVTAECQNVEQVLVPDAEVIVFGDAEMRQAITKLNVTRTGDDIDFIMLGCPHAAYEQIETVAELLAGKRIAENVALWLFTPSLLREKARESGLLETIEASGAKVMSDTCPAIAQFLPPGTRRFATDSAKQAHYLPAIMRVEGAFGTTADCVTAAITGMMPSLSRTEEFA
ncbi:aconitase X catalytic domain-containing protein [Microbacterium sp. BWT-B31]|uniref:aconitase X n=1 Tax=Microbacterium sp. BWT-B31 TaxID=3232072 RepID=UPI003527EEAA